MHMLARVQPGARSTLDATFDEKRRVKAVQADARDGGDLRLSVLGARGLAARFSASHFDGCVWDLVELERFEDARVGASRRADWKFDAMCDG